MMIAVFLQTQLSDPGNTRVGLFDGLCGFNHLTKVGQLKTEKTTILVYL